MAEHAGESPDWVRDAFRQFREELTSFASAAVGVTIHPARFAEEWRTARTAG